MRPFSEQIDMVNAWYKSGLDKDTVLKRCQEDLGKAAGKDLFDKAMLILAIEEGQEILRKLMTPQERALDDIQQLLLQYEDGLESTNSTFNKIWAVCSAVHEDGRGK